MSKLKEKRNAAGLSQAKLGELAGTSTNTIKYYESGYRDINRAPGIILYNISKVLNCKMEDLLEL